MRIRSVGIDTWGVDFGLIDAAGNLLGNPVCYRDEAVEGLPEEFFATHSRQKHYAVNGTQVMAINTMFRLMALRRDAPDMLAAARHLLFMPDLFSYFLTGRPDNEYTIASTSELLDARTRDWDYKLIDELGLPRAIFGKIVMPGTSRGFLRDDVAKSIGVDYPVEVIAVGSHEHGKCGVCNRPERRRRLCGMAQLWHMVAARHRSSPTDTDRRGACGRIYQ